MKKAIRNIISFFITVIVLLGSISFDYSFSKNEIIANAAESQTTISNAQELSNIKNNLSGNYVLANNIDLSSLTSWTPIGTYEEPFTGTFDGNGYSIFNVTISSSNCNDTGFFGYTKNATIKDLGIEKADYNIIIDDKTETVFSNVGGLAGILESSTVERCYFKGSINHTVGNYVFCRTAGIASHAPNSTITNCYVDAYIYGSCKAENSKYAYNTMTAGCVAWLDKTTIDKCYVAGSVVAQNKVGISYVGGFNASSNVNAVNGVIISYGGTVQNSVSLLSKIDATSAATQINNIGNWVSQTNNKTISPTSSDAKNQAIYEQLGWDFDKTWQIDNSLPEFILRDTDGDGIPDNWEVSGVDINGDGKPELDLKAMGADPNVPDIFVEVDWMVRPQKKFLWWEIQSKQSKAPSPEAMRLVYNAFKQHGINLHIDVGPDSTDFVTGKKWGDLSGGNEIPYEEMFSTKKSWNKTINANFSENRLGVFKYCIFINQYDGGTSSGLANDIPGQFFIVANQDWVLKGGDTAIAGTFMHELGHTLGLHHGGCDDEHYKPNYLSIMNYAFQTTGLVGTGSIDYSDYKLPDIDESHIDEERGIDPLGLTSNTQLGTTLFCDTSNQRDIIPISKVSIDFNNNGTLENDISLDLNPNGNVFDEPIAVLKGYKDWSGIIYNGGTIGKTNSELKGSELSDNQASLKEKTLDDSLQTGTLASKGTGYIELLPSSIITGLDGQSLEFEIGNMSSYDTTFEIKIKCDSLFNEFSDSITISGSKDRIETKNIVIPITKNVSLKQYKIYCSIDSSEKTNNYIFNKETIMLSDQDVNAMKKSLSDTKDLSNDEITKINSIINTYESSKSVDICKYCGKTHSGSFIEAIIGFFHKIFYFFAKLFGKM